MNKSRLKISRCLFLVLVLLLVSLVEAAVDGASRTDLLDVMKWRSIGPHRGGRVVAVTGHPTQKEVFYFGGTGSGVWKTTDGGDHWKNVSDGFFKTGSVGAIALSQANPNVLYVGMGESCLRGNISQGDGVYKSNDGGKTWKHTGLTETRHIARIRIHPQNSDIVYVAALGHAFGPNKERGIFKSTDGGKSWKNILFRNTKTGAIDLIMEPGNPRVLYGATWEVQRSPWGFESGGEGSGIFKSTDNGNSWQDLSKNPGLPKGPLGRIGLTVSAANPDRIWAIIEAKKNGLYRSNDNGKNWERVSTDANLLQRPWYYSHIKAHPKNADTLFVMNVGFWKTVDNGKSFKRIRVPHSDNHDLWIDGQDPDRMIEANDGGATVTFNGGRSWSSIYNQPTAQFYHVTTDNGYPYRVYGSQQDNSTISVPGTVPGKGITEKDWYPVGGCESGYIAVHPQNRDIIYAGCYGGSMTRYHHHLKRTQDISVWPENPMGWGAKDLKYRFQWTFPILFSPHDSNVLYAAGNHVFRSTTEGKSWDVISPDLTRNDKSKMEPSGGSLTKDNTSVEYYGTIFAFAESPVKKGVLWAGSDDGLIHLSHDNGKSWQNVTPKQLPPWSLISIIEPSHYDPAVLWVAATRYKLDDLAPYLYVTKDYGKSWKKITRGIPANDFTRVIREDPNRKEVLYAGTETGVYFSHDVGGSWHSLQLNLPVTPIHDLTIRRNDLVAGTHGRSFWILDDLTLLYQNLDLKAKKTSPPTAKKKSKTIGASLPELFLFKPAETVLYYKGYSRKNANEGQSRPVGTIVNYYLKERPEEKVQVTLGFLDQEGELIREYTRKPEEKGEPPVPVAAGMNRFVWDFSYPASRKVKGAVFWGPGQVAPTAIPGSYTVRLTVGKQQFEQDFVVIKDPNYPTTQSEFQQKFDFLVKVRDKLSEAHDGVNEIRSIRKQIKWVTDRTQKEPYHMKLQIAADQLETKLKQVEDALIQHRAKASQDLLNYPIKLNNKLAALGGWVVKSSWGAPTQQAKDVFADLSQRVDDQLKTIREILSEDVVAFNELVRELSVPAVIPEYLTGGED